MNFRSALYIGSVMHHRVRPRAHKFRYRAFWLLLDLEEMDALSARVRFFSHGRFNVWSIYGSDYGDGSATPLREQALRHLADAGIDLSGGAVRLLCMPRLLGYCFNPISIYFCHQADGTLAALLYEVHNTFGERHSYLIPVDSGGRTLHQHCNKAFYVSPFMDLDMRYDFSLRVPGESIAIFIRASRSGQHVMTACLSGRRREFTDSSLLYACLAVPALTFKVTAAIYWEALRLWLKGLRLRRRPAPPAAAVSAVRAHGGVMEQLPHPANTWIEVT